MKRIHSVLILLLIIGALLISSCAQTDDTIKPNENEGIDTLTAAVDTAEKRIDPGLPDADFGGYTFNVLTKGTTNIHWKSIDIEATEPNGETINDAVYARNLAMGEKYNFEIKDIHGDYSNLTGDATKAILAGDNAYDMFCFHVSSLINNGYLYNLYDIPHIDLSKPYYDQNFIEALSIRDRLYAVTGEMLIMDNNATWCVQFNKKLANDYNLDAKYNGSLYDVVESGKWTFDVFHETAKAVADDLNGDGKMHELEDQWGFLTENYNYVAFFFAAGERFISKDADDYPVLTLGGERAISVIEKYLLMQNDNTIALNASKVTGYVENELWSEVMDKTFIDSRVLYNVAGLNRVTLFRSMEVDFGVLPMPKYDEVQERYYNPVSSSVANYIAIPATADNLERTGIIIESLSCESLYTLTPAYYDITLKTKASRDDESSAMLDLIFSTTQFDMGYYYSWGSIYANVFSNLTDSGTFSSKLAANESAINAAIEVTMEVILG